MRARAHIETTKKCKDNIVITELPYQVNKASLIEKIADLQETKEFRESLSSATSQIRTALGL